MRRVGRVGLASRSERRDRRLDASPSSSAAQPAPHVAVHVVTMRGSDAPGPSRYDRVRVLRLGPSSARHVLVLLAGTSAGAGYFVPTSFAP